MELGQPIYPMRSNCRLVSRRRALGIVAAELSPACPLEHLARTSHPNSVEGQVEEVILACQPYSSCTEAVSGDLFTNNIERMRYDRFRAAGYMIGSGTVESGCKQIVTQRLKLPGAQWEVAGAVHTAKREPPGLARMEIFVRSTFHPPISRLTLCLHTP